MIIELEWLTKARVDVGDCGPNRDTPWLNSKHKLNIKERLEDVTVSARHYKQCLGA